MSEQKKIIYYFCLNSPFVYLGQKHLESIAQRHGARISYRPVDLKEMMLRLIGTEDPPERSEAHRRYGKEDMQRWADFFGLPLNLRPRYYPVAQMRAARLVIAADRLGADVGPLVFALPRAVWAEDRDINDPRTLREIAEECGLPGEVVVQASEDPAVQQEFEENTEEALARGVFGIPTYIYGDTLLWGQDRLDFLDRALAA